MSILMCITAKDMSKLSKLQPQHNPNTASTQQKLGLAWLLVCTNYQHHHIPPTRNSILSLRSIQGNIYQYKQTHPNMIYQTQPSLPNQTWHSNLTWPTKLSLSYQTQPDLPYETRPTKFNLTYKTQPDLSTQHDLNYQTQPNLPNPNWPIKPHNLLNKK